MSRQVRKAVQRHWGVSLAGVALLLALQPGSSEAANFTAGTVAELVTAINTANSTAEADTVTLTADITLDKADNTTYGPTGLPVVSSAITIAGKGHAIRREPSAPEFRLFTVRGAGDLTIQNTTLSGGSLSIPSTGLGDRDGASFSRYGQVTLQGCTVSGLDHISYVTKGAYANETETTIDSWRSHDADHCGNAPQPFACMRPGNRRAIIYYQ